MAKMPTVLVNVEVDWSEFEGMREIIVHAKAVFVARDKVLGCSADEREHAKELLVLATYKLEASMERTGLLALNDLPTDESDG